MLSRHDTGFKWVLFFQDTNGLLFKVYNVVLPVEILAFKIIPYIIPEV